MFNRNAPGKINNYLIAIILHTLNLYFTYKIYPYKN
jgi:hypothetical protein